MRQIAAVAALVTAVTLVMLRPLLGGLSDHFLVNARDAAFNSWVLAWGAERLAHGLMGFWSPPVFYPYPNVLAYSENLLGIALIAAPFHWLTGDPILTYNIVLLLSFVVAGVSAYLLAFEVTQSRAGALVAALGFAFAPYRWAQLTHLQVLWTAWLPLLLWALHRALRTSRLSSWIAFVVALLLQIFSNGYAAFQAAVGIGIVLTAAAVRRELNRTTIVRLAAALGVAAMLVLPASLAHVRVWSPHDPDPGELDTYSADLSTYLSVAPALPDSKWLPGLAQDEGNLFPGLVILLLASLAFIPMGRRGAALHWRWGYLAMACVAVLLSLGPEPHAWGDPIPLPPIYRWLAAAVPLFDAMRVPARFGILAILAVNILAACGLARVLPVIRGATHVVPVAACCTLIVFEGYGGPVSVVPYSVTRSANEIAATDWLATQPPGVLLNLPVLTMGETSDMRHQFAVLRHRHPTINGVSRKVTPLVELLSGSGSPVVVPELLPEAVPFLRALGVRYVLVRPYEFFDPGIADRLSATFARDPGAQERRRFGGIIAWEISPADERPVQAPALTRVSPAGLTLSASDSVDRVSLAIDGNPDTRWLTGRPQDGSEWLAVDLDRPRNLARIDLAMHSRSVINFPRLIEVSSAGHGAGGAETLLFRGSVLPDLGRGWRLSPELPSASIRLPPNLTAKLIIRQRGQASPWFWAIDELVLWARD